MNTLTLNTDHATAELGPAPVPGGGNDNPMELELRGYELARWDGRGWTQISHYRPTNRAWSQALADGKWLQERHPHERYQVRPICSMKPPEPEPLPPEMTGETTSKEA